MKPNIRILFYKKKREANAKFKLTINKISAGKPVIISHMGNQQHEHSPQTNEKPTIDLMMSLIEFVNKQSTIYKSYQWDHPSRNGLRNLPQPLIFILANGRADYPQQKRYSMQASKIRKQNKYF